MRVARYLHDVVAQWLAATQFTLEVARPYVQKGDLEKSDQTLSGGVERLHSMARNSREVLIALRSPTPDGAGLVSYLEHAIHDFGQRTGIQIEMHVGAIPTLSTEVEMDFCCFLQQAISNIQKPADATKVQIFIRQDKVCLWMRIHDNGVVSPVSTSQHNEGQWLISMRMRIERHGGELEFQSASGDSRVTAFIPQKHL
jgi:two-component system NarL family sensor kinase